MNSATRKNVLWFLWALGAIALAHMLQSPYMAYAVYAFLLLVTLAHFSSLAWVSGLDCERTVSRTTLQQGEEIDVSVTVTNRRGWPIPWIFLEDYCPVDFPVEGHKTRLATLMPGRSITLKYSMGCPRRGYHRVGPLLMESGDLFGLQKRFRTGTEQEYVSVLPTIAYIDTFNVAAKRPQGPVRISNRIYEDPTRISSIRDYVPGDPLNRIHWKATARTGKLQVKTLEPSSVLGGTLILDLHEDSFKPEHKEARVELAVTTAASIAYLLQMSGEQVGMITNGGDAAEIARYEVDARGALARDEVDAQVAEEEEIKRINPLSVATLRSPIQAVKIAENLARIVPGHGLDAVEMVISETPNLRRDAALLPVVPQVTDELALALGSAKLNGFNVSVFLIRDQQAYEDAAALLAPHNINVFHIEAERDLHEINPAHIGQ
jgi:uncharacterized protein (DUF58 family)